ncbi:MAG: glycosyltransferase [Candidatus Paceibacterota bacterium]
MIKPLGKPNLSILLVGDAVFYGRLNSYKKAFEKIGYKVSFLDDGPLYKISFLNKLFNHFLPKSKTPLYINTGKLNSEIIKFVNEKIPDFVLFFKPVLVRLKTIQKIKSLGIKVFSWYPDDIFYPKNASKDFYDSISFYDCHFSTKSFNVRELMSAGAKMAVFIPHAVDASCHHPVKVSEDEIKKIGADVLFVGTYAKDKRVECLEKLCNDGYDIKIYGNGWNKISHDSCLVQKKCIQFQPLFCEDLSRAFNASKIVLAFLRKHNRDVQTSRTYEIPASGAFMLHERTDEAMSLFKEGKEAEFFGDYEEMKSKIDFYLSHQKERNDVAAAGYKRAVSGDYSYEDRAEKILDIYFKLV